MPRHGGEVAGANPVSRSMPKFIWTLIFITGTPAVLIWSFLLLGVSAKPLLAPRPPEVLAASTQSEPVSQLVIPEISFSATAADGRMYIIKNYLHQYDSPLEPYAGLLVDTSDKYALDYRLMVAIAQQESNLCKKIPVESYNCWGFGIYGDLITRFTSYPQAIDTVARSLKRDYLDQGLRTPEEIMAKYTPPSLGKGGPWAKAVNQFLTELQ